MLQLALIITTAVYARMIFFQSSNGYVVAKSIYFTNRELYLHKCKVIRLVILGRPVKKR